MTAIAPLVVPAARATGKITDEMLRTASAAVRRAEAGISPISDAESALLALVVGPAIDELIAYRRQLSPLPILTAANVLHFPGAL